MITLLRLLFSQLLSGLKSRAVLQAEKLLLRHQIEILSRSAPRRTKLTNVDRPVFIWLLRLWPRCRGLVRVVHPKTLDEIASRRLSPLLALAIAAGRRQAKGLERGSCTCSANERTDPLWSALRIHGEVLKLGVQVSQSTVSPYLPQRPPNPDQTWRTFLRNHLSCTAAINSLVVPTLAFRILFVLVVLSHGRLKLVHVAVTTNPTAAWTAQQITEAFPWDDAPRFLIRDRHRT